MDTGAIRFQSDEEAFLVEELNLHAGSLARQGPVKGDVSYGWASRALQIRLDVKGDPLSFKSCMPPGVQAVILPVDILEDLPRVELDIRTRLGVRGGTRVTGKVAGERFFYRGTYLDQLNTAVTYEQGGGDCFEY